MPFCRSARKAKVVKTVEALTNQHVGRTGEWDEGSEGLNGLCTGSLQWGYLCNLNAIVEV